MTNDPTGSTPIGTYSLAQAAILTHTTTDELRELFGADLPARFTFAQLSALRDQSAVPPAASSPALVQPLRARGREREAAALLARALTLLDLAEVDFEAVEKLLRRSLALDPDQPVAWVQLGVARWACGAKNREVEVFYRRALALESMHAEALYQLSLVRRSVPAEAFELLMLAAEAAPHDLGIQDAYQRALRRIARRAQRRDVADRDGCTVHSSRPPPRPRKTPAAAND